MNVQLTAHHQASTCTWCEKSEKECVTTSFADGFLQEAHLCWNCLQKAVRVRAKQQTAKPTTRSTASD